jgi:tRNA A-37 threonylcarbamoyl transferase component Bud32
MNKSAKTRYARPLALLIGALALGTASLPPLEIVQRADRLLYDLWSRTAPPKIPDDIVVVDLVDSDSIDSLAAIAGESGARLWISTFDQPLSEDGDANAIGPVAIAMTGDDFLRKTAWIRGGVFWALPEFDGVIRHDQPVLQSEAPLPSLALAGSIALKRSDPEAMRPHEIIAYSQPLETDTSGRRWLRYFDRSTIQRRSVDDIVANPAQLQDKVVITGLNTSYQTTPLGAMTAQELMAHSISGYWLDESVTTGIERNAAVWGYAALILIVVGLLRLNRWWGALLPLAGAALLLIAVAASFLLQGIWYPSAGPALLLLIGSISAVWLGRTESPAAAVAGAIRLEPTWISHSRAMPDRPPTAPKPTSAQPASATGTARSPGATREADGRFDLLTLGRYELEKKLGRGAMGLVYLGRDPKINRRVAIKTVNLAEEFEPEDIDEARERFIREAETAGRLNHPNIVTIHDIGEQDGIAYIAMELVRGRLLSDATKPGKLLPAELLIEIAAKAAKALDYAHRHNIVHRDIKPGNIMYDSGTNKLKLMDFGIARLMDVSRTRTGIVLGTPSFMSPEQLQGEKVNGHTDLFALGVSLYQLLTGQLPFRGSSMTALMFAIANDRHDPISSVRTDLPRGIDAVIDKALAKRATDRFSSGAEMANALLDVARTSGRN